MLYMSSVSSSQGPSETDMISSSTVARNGGKVPGHGYVQGQMGT